MQRREFEVRLPHLRLSACSWGNPSLPPLLALHGWLDNAASFDRLAPLLADHFHVVALDLPGHGQSDWRAPGAWYHFVDYPDDVLAAADALGLQQFGLLGHSLGGAIASVFAAICPRRVDRLLLIEALGPLAADAENSLQQWQRALIERQRHADKQLRVFAARDDAVAARMQANGLSRDAAELLISRGLKKVDGGFIWSTDPRLTLTSPLRLTESQVCAVLSGIQVPTLLIGALPGAAYQQRETIRNRAALIKRIDIRQLPGSHHLHLEDAQPVAAAILEFVASG
ncbi:MAG TPA: alpha/beta fold hydrolase, partial [Rudaea sp.]|nr:alpha/beta fold hydrolase [Rudaea sp.]